MRGSLPKPSGFTAFRACRHSLLPSSACRSRSSGQASTHRLQELLWRDGFVKQARDWRFQPIDIFSRHDDDRDVSELRQTCELSAQGVSVDEGEAEIQHDEIGGCCVEHLQRDQAIAGLNDAITRETQRRPEHPPKLAIVFNQEHRIHCRRS